MSLLSNPSHTAWAFQKLYLFVYVHVYVSVMYAYVKYANCMFVPIKLRGQAHSLQTGSLNELELGWYQQAPRDPPLIALELNQCKIHCWVLIGMSDSTKTTSVSLVR